MLIGEVRKSDRHIQIMSVFQPKVPTIGWLHYVARAENFTKYLTKKWWNSGNWYFCMALRMGPSPPFILHCLPINTVIQRSTGKSRAKKVEKFLEYLFDLAQVLYGNHRASEKNSHYRIRLYQLSNHAQIHVYTANNMIWANNILKKTLIVHCISNKIFTAPDNFYEMRAAIWSDYKSLWQF